MSELQVYVQRLRAYYDSTGIAANEESFRCPHYPECSANVGSEKFVRAREADLGEEYGQNDAPRIVVVSSDPASGTRGGFGSQLDELLLAREEDSFNSRKEHWYRTYETVFRFLRETHDPEILFDQAATLFAHISAVRCSENNDHGANASSLMARNCRSYFKPELLALRPQVVITQGERAEDAVRTAYDGWRMLVRPTEAKASLWELGGAADESIIWLRLVHPTAWRGAKGLPGDAYLAEQKLCWPTLFEGARAWLEKTSG